MGNVEWKSERQPSLTVTRKLTRPLIKNWKFRDSLKFWIATDNFNSPDVARILKEYEDLKTEIQFIYDEKGRAAIFRSKCCWVEKGEQPNKYFFNLEKRNFNRKPITELRIEGETMTINKSQILEAIEKYYNELYAVENDVDEFTEYLKIPKTNRCT